MWNRNARVFSLKQQSIIDPVLVRLFVKILRVATYLGRIMPIINLDQKKYYDFFYERNIMNFSLIVILIIHFSLYVLFNLSKTNAIDTNQ